MHANDVRHIAVAGAGLMGHGIALSFAASGYDVHLYARTQQRLDQALDNIQNGLALLQRLGQLTAEQAAATSSRLDTGTVLEVLVADADLVIEAIAEDLAAKQQLFRALDAACPSRTILASTTSTLLPSALAAATRRPDRVLVAHYFNPPTLVPLVELVRGPETSDETVATVRDVLLQVGKHPAVMQKEVHPHPTRRRCCARRWSAANWEPSPDRASTRGPRSRRRPCGTRSGEPWSSLPGSADPAAAARAEASSGAGP
jgi:3-hydroxybutyryl-CoA dehydrogenase